TLSREEFAEHYGADPDDLARLSSFALSHGLDVVESSQPRRSVVLRAPASTLAQLFNTQLLQYRAADGQVYRAPTSDPTIPDSLPDIVQAVFGLDPRPIAHPT